MDSLSKSDQNQVMDLLQKTVIIIVVVGYLCYQMWASKRVAANKEASLKTFFLGEKRDNFNQRFLVGMASGAIFGFIDNAGLFIGMSKLDPYINGVLAKREYYESGEKGDRMQQNIAAGWGNTYSDAVGSFLSVFIGRMISMHFGIEETPMIAESVGLVIGCVLGFKIFEKRKEVEEPVQQIPEGERKYRFMRD